MSNLMMIMDRLKRLQIRYPTLNIQFILYADWSGYFGYRDASSKVIVELEAFNSYEELEELIR